MRTSTIITQLILEHALRIRMKAETTSSAGSTPAVTPENQSEATTPDNVSIADNNVSEAVGGATSEGNEQSAEASTSSSAKGKQKEELQELPASLVADDDSEDRGKSSNLVGKMNNLVSTDLENIIEGRDFLLVSQSFIHVFQRKRLT